MKAGFKDRYIRVPLRHLTTKVSERDMMLVLSLLVGIACGLASVLLKTAVEFIHELLTSWFDGSDYNFLYLIYPGIGMLLALLFVKYVIKDNTVEDYKEKIRKHKMANVYRIAVIVGILLVVIGIVAFQYKHHI